MAGAQTLRPLIESANIRSLALRESGLSHQPRFGAQLTPEEGSNMELALLKVLLIAELGGLGMGIAGLMCLGISKITPPEYRMMQTQVFNYGMMSLLALTVAFMLYALLQPFVD